MRGCMPGKIPATMKGAVACGRNRSLSEFRIIG